GAMAVAFIEPGLAALGWVTLVHTALALKSGANNVLGNADLMSRVRNTEAGNVWAVGRIDGWGTDIGKGGPSGLASQVGQMLPGLKWITASAQVDTGVRGQLRAETQDEQSAVSLGDMIGGVLAFARLQTASRPE